MFKQDDRQLNTQVSLDIGKIPSRPAPTSDEAYARSLALATQPHSALDNEFSVDTPTNIENAIVLEENIYAKALLIVKQSIQTYFKRYILIDKNNYNQAVSLNRIYDKYRTADIADAVNSMVVSLNYTNLCNMAEIKKISAALSENHNVDLSNFIFHLTRRLISSLKTSELEELINAVFSSLTFYQPKPADLLQIKTWSTSANADKNMFVKYPWLLVIAILVDVPFGVNVVDDHKSLTIQINVG